MNGYSSIVDRRAADSCIAIVVVFLLASVVPAIASAQETRWGIEASVTPTWTGDESLQDRLTGVGGWELEGKEFTVGFVRGSIRGGDWGLSYVRKPIREGLHGAVDGSGCHDEFCSSYRSDYVMHDVALQGFELHWFVPFVRIADRLQIGVNAGGGVAFPEGTISETVTSTFTSPTQAPQYLVEHFDIEANDFFYRAVPLVKAEVQGAVRVAQGLKIKVSAGLNAPSTFAFRVGMVYLFGS